MLRVEDKFHQMKMPFKARGLLAAGSQEARGMRLDLLSFTAQVKSHHYEPLEMKSIILEDENHNTIFPSGFSQGLRFVMGLR